MEFQDNKYTEKEIYEGSLELAKKELPKELIKSAEKTAKRLIKLLRERENERNKRE